MPTYVPYRDDLETIAADEAETHAKIIQVMTDGQNVTREKCGKAVRIRRQENGSTLAEPAGID